MITKTSNGSYKFGRFEVFLWVGFSRWAKFNIGDTRVYSFYKTRVFVESKECKHGGDQRR